MVDSSARYVAAEAIRQYLAGDLTNFALDTALTSLKSNDPAIAAIRKQVWLIYDDLVEHWHEGKWKIDAEQQEIMSRIIRFLKSDFEYQWPDVPSWYRAFRPFLWLLTFGIGTSALDRRFEYRDLENVWPFRRYQQQQGAR